MAPQLGRRQTIRGIRPDRRRAYHHAMSRIGTFADDDAIGWATKSPDLGGAIANFSQAVYTKNRLPMRTRELARAVIAHDNQCIVCVNTRDADGPAAGVDEELYEHATEWRTWPGYSEQERLAAEFAAPVRHRTHRAARRRRLLEPLQRALLRRVARRPGPVVRAVDRHGTDAADPGHRPGLHADLAQPRIARSRRGHKRRRRRVAIRVRKRRTWRAQR